MYLAKNKFKVKGKGDCFNCGKLGCQKKTYKVLLALQDIAGAEVVAVATTFINSSREIIISARNLATTRPSAGTRQGKNGRIQ